MSAHKLSRLQPLHAAQLAIWMAAQVDSRLGFSVSHVLDLTGWISLDELRDAFDSEVRLLRVGAATFVVADGAAVMNAIDQEPVIAQVDCSSSDNPLDAAQQWISEQDADAELVGFTHSRYTAVVRLAEDRHLIYCRGHHVAYDGYSAIACMTLASSFYNKPSQQLPPVDLTASLEDERIYRHSDDRVRDAQYWHRDLVDSHQLRSPSNRYRAADPQVTILDHRLAASSDLLRGLSEGGTASVPSLLASAVVGFLSRISGVEDQIAQFPVTARVTPAQLTSPIPHSNMVPLRVVVESDLDAAGLLSATRAKVRTAIEHQRYRYEDILADLGPREKRALEGPRGLDAPQLNLMLFDSAMAFGDCEVTYNVRQIGPIDDIAILFYYDGPHKDLTTLRLGLRANPRRYSDADVAELHTRIRLWLETYLTALVHGDHTPVHELPLITSDETQRLSSIVGPDLTTPTGRYARDDVSPELGVAIAGGRCLVVDGHGRLLPPGMVGELLIAPPDQPLAVTGHRARWVAGTLDRDTPDGDTPVLEYGGRTDDVVDLGDLTVELHALDELVCTHPSVAASASTWSSNAGSSATGSSATGAAGHLVIHVALEPKAPSDIRQQLTEHLIKALPKAIRPDRLELLDHSYLGVVTALRIHRRGPLDLAVRGTGLALPGVDITAGSRRPHSATAWVDAEIACTDGQFDEVMDGASMLTAVHAAVAGYIAYAGGTRDLVVGTPDPASSDRSAPTEALAAHANVPLALRSHISPDLTVGEALQSVTIADHAVFDDARRRTEAAFDLVDVHLSAAARPTFEVNVVDLTVTSGLADTHGLSLEIGPGADPHSRQLRLRYPASSMNGQRAVEILTAITGLVEAMLAEPERTIGDVLAGTPATIAEMPTEATLGSILDTALRTHHDAVALEDLSLSPPVRLHYSDLAVAAGEVARDLRARGVGPEDVVALHIGRSAYSVICTVACAWVGAAFVQLNPDDPTERKLTVVARSAARVVLSLGDRRLEGVGGGLDTVRSLRSRSYSTGELGGSTDDLSGSAGDWGGSDGEGGGDVVEVIVRPELAIPHWLSFNRPPEREPFAPVPLDTAAYLTFTSGTTGEPKGVAVTHRGLLPWASSVVDAAHVTANSRVLHNYSVVFDAHLIEVIPTLMSGATIVVCPPEIIGGNELRALLHTQQITTFYSTPSVLATIDQPAGADDLTVLDTVVVGGEPLSTAVAAPWATSRRLVNFYGPTETTVAVTGDVPVDPSTPITIGRPLAGVTAHVLDDHLRPMPANAIGELYIAGPSVARGYVDLPAHTASGFVANPFTPGERMYRTGDRVHRDTDGRLVIHGRVDDQIKLHGIRIEPAEINAALLRIPGVRDAYTALGPDHVGENVLVSWVVVGGGLDTPSASASGYSTGGEGYSTGEEGYSVGGGGYSTSGDAIRSRLREYLPRTYLPTAVVPVEAFPLTANGKVDQRALPDWRSASMGGIAANELEEIVLKHFRRALGMETVGVRDNFFTLGGDSLRAVEAAGAIEREIGRLVPVRLFFDYSTARALAGVLTEEATYNSAVATMVPSDADGPERPMAPFQQRFWFLHSAFPTSSAYLVPIFLPTPADATREQVAEAFAILVQRHEPLRTIYGNGPAGPFQQVLPHNGSGDPEELMLPEIDPHDDDAVRRHLTAPFDLSVEPPMRTAFISGTGGVGRGVFLVVHHLIVDRESVIVLQRELDALLRGEMLPELAYTYADTARWHIDLLHGLRPELLDFWEQQLRGFGAMELSRTPIEDPAQRPPIITVDKVYHHGLTLTHDQHVGISDVARRLGATEFHVIHAALALALAAQANTDDVLVVAPTTLRHRLRGGDLVGAFITGVLLRTKLTAGVDADDYVRSVKNNDVIAFDSALVPVEEIGMRIDFAKLIPGHLPVQVGLTYDTVEHLYPLVTDDEPSAALSELELHVTAARSPSETQLVFGCADPLVRSDDGWLLIRRFQTALDMLLAGGVIDYGRLRLATDTN